MPIKIFDHDLVISVDTEGEFRTVMRVLRGADAQLEFQFQSSKPARQQNRPSTGNPFEDYWNRLSTKEHRIVVTALYQFTEGLTDKRLRAILELPGDNNSELAKVMTGLSKHAKAVGLEFKSQVVCKEIGGRGGQRVYHYTLANPMRGYMDTMSELRQVRLPDNKLGAENSPQPPIHHNGEHAERVNSVADPDPYQPGRGSDHET